MQADKVAKEYQMLEKSVREFAAKMLRPRLEENDRYPVSDDFAKAVEKAMALEYFSVMLPEDMNGFGGKTLPLGIVLSCISETDAAMGAMILTNAVAQEIMLTAGETDIVRDICGKADWSRELLIAFPLLTDPEEDEILLSAKKEDGKYRLSGTAEYVVMGPMARRALVPAKLGNEPGYGFFLVDLDLPESSSQGAISSAGLHACPASDIKFMGAQARLMGRMEDGPRYYEQTCIKMLPAAAAVAGGLMQGSMKEALSYCKKRRQGGRRIIDWSELRLILSDMLLAANTGRILLDNAFRAVDAHSAKWAEDALTASVYVLETACRQTSDGIQALGGYGYTKHSFQERRFRDAQHLRSIFGSAVPRRLAYAKLGLNC